jgi:hypothetical protein
MTEFNKGDRVKVTYEGVYEPTLHGALLVTPGSPKRSIFEDAAVELIEPAVADAVAEGKQSSAATDSEKLQKVGDMVIGWFDFDEQSKPPAVDVLKNVADLLYEKPSRSVDDPSKDPVGTVRQHPGGGSVAKSENPNYPWRGVNVPGGENFGTVEVRGWPVIGAVPGTPAWSAMVAGKMPVRPELREDMNQLLFHASQEAGQELEKPSTKTQHITYGDCRTEEGVTIGLIDGIITMARVLVQRDLNSTSTREALTDLQADEDVASILTSAMPPQGWEDQRPLWTGDGGEEPPEYVTKVRDSQGLVSVRGNPGWYMQSGVEQSGPWHWDAMKFDGPYAEVRDV